MNRKNENVWVPLNELDLNVLNNKTMIIIDVRDFNGKLLLKDYYTKDKEKYYESYLVLKQPKYVKTHFASKEEIIKWLNALQSDISKTRTKRCAISLTGDKKIVPRYIEIHRFDEGFVLLVENGQNRLWITDKLKLKYDE